jgi:hypothetical protein
MKLKGSKSEKIENESIKSISLPAGTKLVNNYYQNTDNKFITKLI